MHFFRKHQKWVLGFIILFVGAPMLFFGLPSFMGQAGPGQDMEIASVEGVPIMASEFRRNLSAAAQRQARGGGEAPSYAELEEQGVAGDVFEQMMVSALITSMEEERGFDVKQEFLEYELKEYPLFQDDAGNFNGARFNAWVKSNPNQDWGAIYDSIEEDVSRQAFMAARLAAANRVLDADVQEELEDTTTKIQMEYVKVEPPVELTDEEIQAHYDENGENYQDPPTYTAQYVAISLKPEGPGETVDEVLKKARAGEDFAALADEYSDLATKNGGDLGWLSERETELDYRKPLFELGVGDVSDPVEGPNGYYIYKVEEERTNEETEKREVKARHIYIKVALSEEERAAREEAANKLAETAREKGLAEAATEAGKTVETASGFNVESAEIPGIPKVDAFQFRRAIDEMATAEEPDPATDDSEQEEAPEYTVITGRDNLYVADFVSQEPGDVPPLAEVRNEVVDDLTAAKKGEDAYKEKTAALAEKIVAEAKTLDEVKEKFPALDVQIKETRPFTKQEYLFQDQIYLQTQDIYNALEDKEAGEIAGPLTDFLGATYFIALTNRVEPTEEDKENWDEKGKEIRDRLLATARYEMTQDYTEHLKQRYLPNAVTRLDSAVYEGVLGINEPGEDDADTTEGDSAGEGGSVDISMPATADGGAPGAPVEDADGGDAAETDAPAADDTPVTDAPAADDAPATEAPAPETPAAEAPAADDAPATEAPAAGS